MIEQEKAIEAIKNDLEWHKKELKPMYRKCLNMAMQALEKQIVKTNADRIRNMTDEELAELLSKLDFDDFCQNKIECNDFNNITDENCKRCAVEWLQKEVEE